MPETFTAKALLCGVLLLCASRPGAQSEPVPATPVSGRGLAWQGGAGGLGASSQGDFSTNVGGAGGLLIHLDRRLRGSVFSLGGELAYMVYGDESRDVALGSLIPEVPDASVTVNTENAMLLLHARLRAQRRAGRWRPYADGLFGFNDLFTKSSVEGAQDCSGDSCSATEVAGATHSRDFVLSYGGGAGVMYVFRSTPGTPKLDFSVRYLRGGEADYLTEGAVRPEGANAVLDFSRSRTDMLTVYIGVAFGR